MSPRYLVQVRGSGEPWKTVETLMVEPQARHVADEWAALKGRWYARGVVATSTSHVRVTFRGRLVYDPRAPKAVAP